jgi:hypothetical protein
MTHTFNHIETSLEGCYVVILASNDDEVVVEAKVSNFRLERKYPDEFTRYRYVLNQWDKPPEYIPTGDTIPLKDWYDEYLKGNKAKAWDIFNDLDINSLTLITNE